MRPFMVAGNWKMNTTRSSAESLAAALAAGWSQPRDDVEVLVCPPFPYLNSVGDAIAGSAVLLGAQNAYFEARGAFTGEVAVEMLLDVGCRYVILGHSERRHVLCETDGLINQKVSTSLAAGLPAILCVGEKLEERENDTWQTVLDTQLDGGLAGLDEEALDGLVIAYEPVWAIGTGRTAEPADAESAHAHLRNRLENRYNSTVAEATRILYGGSVKPDNALALLGQPNVDGALVGGASLKAESFLAIVEAAVQIADR